MKNRFDRTGSEQLTQSVLLARLVPVLRALGLGQFCPPELIPVPVTRDRRAPRRDPRMP